MRNPIKIWKKRKVLDIAELKRLALEIQKNEEELFIQPIDCRKWDRAENYGQIQTLKIKVDEIVDYINEKHKKS